MSSLNIYSLASVVRNISSLCSSMSPSFLSTFRISRTSTLDGGSDQGHRIEPPYFTEKGQEVQLEPEDDPQQLSLCRRWLAVATISSAGLCVACASSIASICDLVFHQFLKPSCSLSGLFYCRRCGARVQCGKRSGDLRNQYICHWSRHRSSPFRTTFGSVWSKHRLSCIIHSLFRLHIPGCFCTQHR